MISPDSHSRYPPALTPSRPAYTADTFDPFGVTVQVSVTVYGVTSVVTSVRGACCAAAASASGAGAGAGLGSASGPVGAVSVSACCGPGAAASEPAASEAAASEAAASEAAVATTSGLRPPPMGSACPATVSKDAASAKTRSAPVAGEADTLTNVVSAMTAAAESAVVSRAVLRGAVIGYSRGLRRPEGPVRRASSGWGGRPAGTIPVWSRTGYRDSMGSRPWAKLGLGGEAAARAPYRSGRRTLAGSGDSRRVACLAERFGGPVRRGGRQDEVDRS